MNKESFKKVIRVGALAAAVATGGYAAGGGLSRPTEAAPQGNSGIVAPNINELVSPAPTAVDLGSPAPEATPSLEAPSVVESFHINALETMEVQPGDLVIGDVAMSDTLDGTILPLYDQDSHKAVDVLDNTKTALYINVQAPGVVHAEWGADVMRGMTNEQKATFLNLQKAAKEAAGFTVVDLVTWTGSETTVDQAGLTQHSLDLPVSEQPTVTPEPGATTVPGAEMTFPADLSQLSDRELEELQAKLLWEIMQCTCVTGNCPMHSPEPSATPAPTATPEVCPPMVDNFMEPGDTFRTEADKLYIVQGDVKVDGKAYYDNNADTFAVLKLSGEHTIRAQWGADVQEFCPQDAAYGEIYNKDVEEGQATGRTLDNHSDTIN